MKKFLTLLLIGVSTLLGCTDEIERLPLEDLVIETTFTSDANFEAYAWGLYSGFFGYDRDNVYQDFNSDLALHNRGVKTGSNWVHGRITVPAESDTWNEEYAQIRRANIMIANLEGSPLNEEQQNHWRSVGLFFRSTSYMNLLNRYGGVPWIETAISDSDTEVLFGPRASREVVAANILRDLTFAEANIRADGSSNNSIDTDVIRALVSRFGLREGSWRKYHGLGGEDEYLRASAEASERLMPNYTLSNNYDLVFNSEDLTGYPGIIFFKAYVQDILTHRLTSLMRNASGVYDFTKKGADKFLYKDGTPPAANPNFSEGAMLERNAYTEFADRDERMYYSIVPPFRINRGGNTKWDFYSDASITDPVERKADSIQHRIYIDWFAANSDPATNKTLPESNWRGFLVRTAPHFREFPEGQNFNASRTGYKLYKYYNNLNLGLNNRDVSDSPIFRLGEILVNYAEAKFELGEFNQSIANATISKLRNRGGVAPLNIGAIIDDPSRDTSVDPVLWEIRRERFVELAGEGFRWDDLRRWHKMDYVEDKKLGRWIERADYKNKLPVDGGGTEGYVSFWPDPPSFPDFYYLFPIPSNERVINPALDQNPGWE